MSAAVKQWDWTNPSVRRFADTSDPVERMIERARELVLEAQEQGWKGPPFDPFELAAIKNIPVVPRQDIADARTVPVDAQRVSIEFNPERPRARTRYSIAHEIAHTLFADCADRIRNRLASSEIADDEWQLEMLCNLGASEILMPIGSFSQLQTQSLSINRLIELRKDFGVSAEAMLLRVTRLTDAPCLMFAAASDDESSQYRLDYSVSSRAWPNQKLGRIRLPNTSCVTQCTAIDFTAHADEEWPGLGFDIHVECVGIPPYPGRRLPRVVGVATPTGGLQTKAAAIAYVTGDALTPRGEGPHVICHVVNDVTPNWGGGFAKEVRKKWNDVQEDFRTWWNAQQPKPVLGDTHIVAAIPNVHVCSMIAQHGLGGTSSRPKIRYNALAQGLTRLAEIAHEFGARVHMPRIGCGQAGGSWAVVAELVDEILVQPGIETFVYDLPGKKGSTQKDLF